MEASRALIGRLRRSGTRSRFSCLGVCGGIDTDTACAPPPPTVSLFVQFALLRLVKLDLEAEPDLTGVRYPQAAHTQGWSCSLDAGPNGANTHCIHTTAGSPYDIGDFDRGDSPMR